MRCTPSSPVRQNKFLSSTQGRKLLFSLFASLLLLQPSDAQDNDTTPNYSFHVALPPPAGESDVLTLPTVPLYDQDNRYLQVRDSSQDWYPEQTQAPEEGAIYQTFANKDTGAFQAVLNPQMRILPDLQAADVLLDETLMPIPR